MENARMGQQLGEILSGSTRVERNECNCNFASEMKTH
jgi:hypothetical protein